MESDPDLLVFGRAVRQLRVARKLSQEELAHRAGLHRNYIGGIERGERNVGVKAVFALARGLGCAPADFFNRHATDVGTGNTSR
ncbi:MAG TPA: transcriptional regulator [Brevundimonas sp.]|nr:transcriptional regulator [Brevundimonas sp.]